jgi:hypothetical protein
MYSGKIAVPPGGGGIVYLLSEKILTYLVEKKIVYKPRLSPL